MTDDQMREIRRAFKLVYWGLCFVIGAIIGLALQMGAYK